MFDAEAAHANDLNDGLTPAQRKQQAKRLDRAQQDAPSGDSSAALKITPVPLSVMLSEGGGVLIGGQRYEVAAFPLGKLAQAGRLIAQCPDMLVTAALSDDGGGMDAGRVIEVTNRLMQQANPDASPLDSEMVGYALATLTMEITDDQAAAMTDLVVLALSRRRPDVTPEMIGDDLDIDVFFAVLLKIFEANKPLKRRFS